MAIDPKVAKEIHRLTKALPTAKGQKRDDITQRLKLLTSQAEAAQGEKLDALDEQFKSQSSQVDAAMETFLGSGSDVDNAEVGKLVNAAFEKNLPQAPTHAMDSAPKRKVSQDDVRSRLAKGVPTMPKLSDFEPPKATVKRKIAPESIEQVREKQLASLQQETAVVRTRIQAAEKKLPEGTKYSAAESQQVRDNKQAMAGYRDRMVKPGAALKTRITCAEKILELSQQRLNFSEKKVAGLEAKVPTSNAPQAIKKHAAVIKKTESILDIVKDKPSQKKHVEPSKGTLQKKNADPLKVTVQIVRAMVSVLVKRLTSLKDYFLGEGKHTQLDEKQKQEITEGLEKVEKPGPAKEKVQAVETLVTLAETIRDNPISSGENREDGQFMEKALDQVGDVLDDVGQGLSFQEKKEEQQAYLEEMSSSSSDDLDADFDDELDDYFNDTPKL